MIRNDVMTFFALVFSRDGNQVRTLPVTKRIQLELIDELERQRQLLVASEIAAVEFDPGYKLDEDEVFVISDFVLPSEVEGALRDSEALSPISEEEIETGVIKATFGVYPGPKPKIVFQSFNASYVISRKSWLVLSGNVFDRANHAGVVIPTRPAAVLEGRKLYFESFATVSRFLPLADHFTEATDAQVKHFVAHDLFAVDDEDRVIESLNQWCRKRIALIARAANIDSLDAETLARRARRYGLVLDVRRSGKKPSKLGWPTDKALKPFLQFMAEELVEAGLTGKLYQVNSKRPL